MLSSPRGPMTTALGIWIPAFAGTPARTNCYRISMRGIFSPLLLATLALAAAAPAQAQEAWPQRPVTIIVPFAAGRSAGLLPHLPPQHLQAEIPPPIVVEEKNRARGPSGTRRLAAAARRGFNALRVDVS